MKKPKLLKNMGGHLKDFGHNLADFGKESKNIMKGPGSASLILSAYFTYSSLQGVLRDFCRSRFALLARVCSQAS